MSTSSNIYTYFLRLSEFLVWLYTNNSNRTNRNAINAKIIRVVTKSADRVAGG